ncbi:MAG TPA: hypothetical protein VF430_05390, partial [Verrucomicrobiae bacterium]
MSPFYCPATTPLGLFVFMHVSQGSSFLATLGYKLESLWDSHLGLPKGNAFMSAGIKHPCWRNDAYAKVTG